MALMSSRHTMADVDATQPCSLLRRSTHFARLARMNLTGQVALDHRRGQRRRIGFACAKSLAATVLTS
jgi:hypothetical protein